MKSNISFVFWMVACCCGLRDRCDVLDLLRCKSLGCPWENRSVRHCNMKFSVSNSVKKFLHLQYTFILTASKELPKQCTRYGTAAAKYAHRKSVGVRIPDDAICQAILERMDSPLISTRFEFFCVCSWCISCYGCQAYPRFRRSY